MKLGGCSWKGGEGAPPRVDDLRRRVRAAAELDNARLGVALLEFALEVSRDEDGARRFAAFLEHGGRPVSDEARPLKRARAPSELTDGSLLAVVAALGQGASHRLAPPHEARAAAELPLHDANFQGRVYLTSAEHAALRPKEGKRRLLGWGNTEDGRKLRLSGNQHIWVPERQKKPKCVICGAQTRGRCGFCNVALHCTRKNNPIHGSTTCFEKWHNEMVLEPFVSGGGPALDALADPPPAPAGAPAATSSASSSSVDGTFGVGPTVLNFAEPQGIAPPNVGPAPAGHRPKPERDEQL